MSTRRLYIAAYDVRSPKRLARALNILRDYATGGQKSVFECFLTPAEHRELCRRIQGLLSDKDRFFILPHGSRRKPRALGRGRIAKEPDYFYLK